MSNADWYAQRLAQARGRQQPQPAPQPPQYPPTHAPGQLPAHLAPYAPQQPQQQVPQGYQQQMPGQQPQSQPGAPMTPAELLAMVQSGQLGGTSYTADGAQVADDGHVAMLAYSAGTTGGSKIVKENSTTCPNCNGSNYFTIQEGGTFSKAVGGIVKAAQCADCGYPKVQAGSAGGSLAGSRGGGGPAKPSRQLPANHRVTVAVEGGGYATFEPPTGSR